MRERNDSERCSCENVIAEEVSGKWDCRDAHESMLQEWGSEWTVAAGQVHSGDMSSARRHTHAGKEQRRWGTASSPNREVG